MDLVHCARPLRQMIRKAHMIFFLVFARTFTDLDDTMGESVVIAHLELKTT